MGLVLAALVLRDLEDGSRVLRDEQTASRVREVVEEGEKTVLMGDWQE